MLIEGENFPPLPRKESKFTPDYQMEIKFIPETGVVSGSTGIQDIQVQLGIDG